MSEFALWYAPAPVEYASTSPLIGGRHPQAAFHADRYDVTYRACFAGTGAGKTLAGVVECLAWMLENPGCRGAASEPDLPMVRRILIPTWEEVLGRSREEPWPNQAWEEHPLVASWNRSEFHLRLVNASELWFVGLEEPEKHGEGQNLNFWHADEVRKQKRWPEALKTIIRRTRRPGQLVGAWFTSHSPTEEQVAVFEGPEDTRLESSRVYRWTPMDMQPILGERYIRVVLASHAGAALESVVYGKYARPEGLVLDAFDPRGTPDGNVAAWPVVDGRPVAWDRATGGVDWGWTLPACINVCRWRNDRAHLVGEVYGTHMSDEDVLRACLQLEDVHGRIKWWCGADRPEAVAYLRRGDPVKGLRGVDAESYTGRVVDGITILNSMLRGRELLVDPACSEFIRESGLYARRQGSEEPEKGNDHAVDALRYNVCGSLQSPRVPPPSVVRESTKRTRLNMTSQRGEMGPWNRP